MNKKGRKYEGAKGRKYERAKGNKQDSSLRGTKQSRIGEFVGVFLLDCFTAFAMTGGIVVSLPCTLFPVPFGHKKSEYTKTK
jgi:hypothetical protein